MFLFIYLLCFILTSLLIKALSGNIEAAQLAHVSMNALRLGNSSDLVLRKNIISGQYLLRFWHTLVLKVSQTA